MFDLNDLTYGMLDDDKNVISVSLEEHRAWAEVNPDWRRVGYDTVGRVTISTVFLPICHSGMWFETLVFPYNDLSEITGSRYMTWGIAVEGHAMMVEKMRDYRRMAFEEIGRPIPK